MLSNLIVAFCFLICKRVLKVIEDLQEVLGTKETRYIYHQWLTFYSLFKVYSIICYELHGCILMTFSSYKQGHPGPPGHPGAPGLMGTNVSCYFGYCFEYFVNVFRWNCRLFMNNALTQASYLLCWHYLFRLQGNDGQPGTIGPPGPPGEKVRLLSMYSLLWKLITHVSL